MSDYFNETHEQVRQTARKFIETHVRPHIDDWEEAGESLVKFINSPATPTLHRLPRSSGRHR